VNIFDVVVVQPIFNLLIGLYSLIPGGDFGIALIIFTILVRFALWPLVKKQLHQVTAMRKLQPQLAKIKKNAGGNRQLESIQMMDLYKKNGVNPFRSIGILLIQLPIFIAIYQVVIIFSSNNGQAAAFSEQIKKYTYDFLENLAPIKELIAHPDLFNEKLFGFVDLTVHAIGSNGINVFLVLLAIIAAITQYIMSKQTMPQTESKKRLRDIMSEAAEGKKADQSEMNAIVTGKMIKFLPFLMLIIMLNLPGALALYYAVSNIVAVFQQHYILKKDVQEMEAIAEEAPKTVGKKATAKARAKVATEGNIIRITAKDSRPNKTGKKEKS
jgi:YidC/Oxa1 family membrane protein insertase